MENELLSYLMSGVGGGSAVAVVMWMWNRQLREDLLRKDRILEGLIEDAKKHP